MFPGSRRSDGDDAASEGGAADAAPEVAPRVVFALARSRAVDVGIGRGASPLMDVAGRVSLSRVDSVGAVGAAGATAALGA